MDHTEKLLLRASEVSQIAGLGKSKTYELIAAGVIPSVRIGKSVRVPAAQLRAWIEGLPSAMPSESVAKS
jgi:excisionase family DNA binding protein